MADEEKPQEQPKTQVQGGNNKILVILSALNLVITLGVIGVLIVSFSKESSQSSIEDISLSEEHKSEGEGGEHGEEEQYEEEESALMVALEQFTVNLSSGGGSASQNYVRVNISLDVGNEDVETEVNQRMPQLRNIIIDLFNSKTSVDLAKSTGRSALKSEILDSINSFMITGKVKGVFFTNFAVSG